MAGNYRKMMFLDFETTGLDAECHEVIQAAWKLVGPDAKTVLERGVVKVLPEHVETASPEALKVNGYTPAAWTPENSLRQEEFFRMFQPKLANVVLAGQGVNFDEGFLKAGCKRFGLKVNWHYQSVDTQKIAWPLYAMGKVPGVSLKFLAPYFKVGTQNDVHDAEQDVELTHQVFLAEMALYTAALSS